MPETVVHFQIRMPPHLHETLATRAKDEKISLNALIVGIITDAVQAPAEAAEPAPTSKHPSYTHTR